MDGDRSQLDVLWWSFCNFATETNIMLCQLYLNKHGVLWVLFYRSKKKLLSLDNAKTKNKTQNKT